jgi:hypothetical protein
VTPIPSPALQFTLAGPNQARFTLRINQRYVLVGLYVAGVLREITLKEIKPTGAQNGWYRKNHD